MKKSLNVLLSAGLVLSMVLAGCGSKDPAPSADAVNPEPTQTTSTEAPANDAAPTVNSNIKKSSHVSNVKATYTSYENVNGVPNATVTLYDDGSSVLEYKGLKLTGLYDDYGSHSFIGTESKTGFLTTAYFTISERDVDNNQFLLKDLYFDAPIMRYGETGQYAPILLKGEYGDIGIIYDTDGYWRASVYPSDISYVDVGMPYDSNDSATNDLTSLSVLRIGLSSSERYVYMEHAQLTFDGVTDSGLFVYTYSCESPYIDDYSAYGNDGYSDYNYDNGDGYDGWDTYDSYDGWYEAADLSDEEYAARVEYIKNGFSNYDAYDGEGLFSGYLVFVNDSYQEVILYDVYRDYTFASGYISKNVDGTYSYSIASSEGYQDGTFKINKSSNVVDAYFNW